MRLASYEVTIAAPADVVWTHLTTAAGLVRWIGPDAVADDHERGWAYFLGVMRDRLAAP